MTFMGKLFLLFTHPYIIVLGDI